MTEPNLSALYREYIACLNAQDWAELGRFVCDDARHNGRAFGLAGYRAMLEGDFDAIPDLHFRIELLVVEAPHVAARLRFDCTPKAMLFGLPVNGRRVSFCENVIYEFRDGRIAQVWSIIDKAAIEAQISPRT
jgi:predicted ester cyclase